MQDIGERRAYVMSKSKVRINLKAFDANVLDLAAGKIVDTVKSAHFLTPIVF